MEFLRLLLGGSIALAFFRMHVQQHRAVQFLCRPQHIGQSPHIMAVHRSHVGKAHTLKHGADRQQRLLQRRFYIVAQLVQLLSGLAAVQRLPVLLLEFVVARLRPDLCQVA